MNHQINPALLGAFVLGALAIAFVALLTFSGGKLWSEHDRYVVYFTESVNGLSIGAPVKIRGVQVGKVTEILVQYQPEDRTLTTPVILEVDLEPLKIDGKGGFLWQRPALDDLIQEGLRARLKLQSLVTGQLYVDLDFQPHTPVSLVGTYQGLAEIPSIPSSQEEIENTINELVREVRQLPLKDTVQKLNATLTHLEAVLGQPEWRTSAHKLDQVLDNLDRLSEQLGPRLDQVSRRLEENLAISQRVFQRLDSELTPLLQQGRGALRQTEQTLAGLSQTLSPESPLVGELATALEEVREAARGIQILTEMLQTQPETLLRGKQEDKR